MAIGMLCLAISGLPASMSALAAEDQLVEPIPSFDGTEGEREAHIAARDYALRLLSEEGFSPGGTGIRGFVGEVMSVESGRLAGSGVRVLRITRRLSDEEGGLADSVLGPEIVEYYEVETVRFDERDVFFLRPMNPDEVLQYEREAAGLSNEQTADQLEGIAGGIATLMEGFGSMGLPAMSVTDFIVAERAADIGLSPEDRRVEEIYRSGRLDPTALLRYCESIREEFENPHSTTRYNLLVTIGYLVGPECFLRSTAAHLRQLDAQTEGEKRESREAMSAALGAIAEIVSSDEDTVVIGIDAPVPAETGALWNEEARYPAAIWGAGEMQVDQMSLSGTSGRTSAASPGQIKYLSSPQASPPGVGHSKGVAGFLKGLVNRGSAKTSKSSEPTFVMSRYEVKFDRRTFKRLGMKMFGTMEQEGQTRPVLIEQENADFRGVAGSVLYEPYRETSRVSGMVSPEQQAQMRAQLADLERQLARMPADRRAQTQQMMGGQMEQMRSLARDGSIEITRITTSIEINPPLGRQNRGLAGGSFVSDETLDTLTGGQASPGIGSGQGTGQGSVRMLDESGMLRMIQESLATLGYDPGIASGQISRQTTIAITQFEADKGMPVTGRPTPQLAGILAAEVDAQR